MIDVKGKSIFLSGPMTGIDLYNAPAFVEAHARLKLMGCGEAFNPAIEWLWDDSGSEDRLYYMRRCIEALGRGPLSFNSDHWDMLVSLPGWEDSEGARLERTIAESLGIECHDLEEVVGDK